MDESEAMFAKGFALHGKVVSGSTQMPNLFALDFDDGTELVVRFKGVCEVELIDRRVP